MIHFDTTHKKYAYIGEQTDCTILHGTFGGGGAGDMLDGDATFD